MNLPFKKTDLKNYGQWIQPTLSGTFWCHWFEADNLEKLTMDKEMHQCIFLNGHTMSFNTDVAHVARMAKNLLEPKQAKKYLETLALVTQKYEKEHLKLLTSSTNNKIYLPELFRTYRNIVGIWWLSIPLAEELEKLVRKSWPKLTDEDLFVAARPIKPTWLQLQGEGVKTLAEKCKKTFGQKNITLKLLKKKPSLLQEITKHANTFEWFGTHHWMGPAYTISRAIDEINEQIGKPTAAKNKLHSSPLPEHIIRLLRTFNYWRTHSAELTAKVVFKSRPVLTALAKSWRISYEDLLYLSHVEISENLHSKSLPKKLLSQIRARKKAYGCILTPDGTEQIFTGKIFQKSLNKLVDTKIKPVKSLTGTPASKGPIVRAKARVVMSPRDFPKFKKGEILVTNETTPDFVPIMKLSSAIITDTGGITSHAAIVSRELGIPCVVGTKHSTKNFKTGDMLEMDSNKGIIKKGSCLEDFSLLKDFD